MRKVLALMLLLTALLAFGGPAPARAEGKADVLVVGMAISDIISLDPAKAFEFSGVGVEVQIYDRLLDFEPGKFDKPVLSLAESFKVSEDGKTWQFKLKPGVKFHSGNEVTAEDVVYSFKRVVILQDQPSFILTQFGITPESLKAVDKYTVEIGLDKKYAQGIFFSCLSAGVASIVDSKVVMQHVEKTDKYPEGDFGLTWLTRNSAGSGPFKLVAWQKNDKVVLDAFPGHFSSVPKVKRVCHQGDQRGHQPPPPGGEGRHRHRLPDVPGPDQGAEEEPGHRDQERHQGSPSPTSGSTSPTVPSRTPRSARPCVFAVDYDGIINNIMGGAGKPINSFIPEGFAGYTDKLWYKRDVAKAKELLKEAGVADGVRGGDGPRRPVALPGDRPGHPELPGRGRDQGQAEQDGHLPAVAQVPGPEAPTAPGPLGTRLHRPPHQTPSPLPTTRPSSFAGATSTTTTRPRT